MIRDRLLRLWNHPQPVRLVIRKCLSHFPLPFALGLELGSLPYHRYAYGMLESAKLAAALGLREMSAIEFGVAGGNGLVAMESFAREIHRMTGVKILCHGFDRGAGLPRPVDYRDQPYYWVEGSYVCNESKLKARLNGTRIYWGEIAETVGEFSGPPVGFVSIDVDLYSSARDALRIFDVADHLPRVFCWLDDTFHRFRSDMCFYSDRTGERLAVREFNEGHPRMTIERLEVPAHMLVSLTPGMYIFHDFDHPLYCAPLGRVHQSPLR